MGCAHLGHIDMRIPLASAMTLLMSACSSVPPPLEHATRDDSLAVQARTTTAAEPTPRASPKPLQINAADLIRAVQDGADYSGRDLLLTGVALNSTANGLVNVGTRLRPSYDNFISVYEVPVPIREGDIVTLRVHVEASSVSTIRGTRFVLIDTRYRGTASADPHSAR